MKTAEIKNIKPSITGTTKFDMKAGRMRKPQNFVVYPMTKNDEANIIRVQSGNYWAEINAETGEGELSGRHSHANTWAFTMDKQRGKTTKFNLSDMDLQSLRMQIFTSADKEAGKRENGIMQTDNSGAINVLS